MSSFKRHLIAKADGNYSNIVPRGRADARPNRNAAELAKLLQQVGVKDGFGKLDANATAVKLHRRVALQGMSGNTLHKQATGLPSAMPSPAGKPVPLPPVQAAATGDDPRHNPQRALELLETLLRRPRG